ncbi:MAG: hypothetical protein ABIU54_01000 [Candidatus Eisenbacteria bacterium]
MIRRALMGFAAILLLAGPASAAGVAGAQFRYWAFDDGNDIRDPIVYFAPGPFHVQLEYWDVVNGDDQFRPEVGLHLRDARRSVYTTQWRHEKDAERFWIGTEQVVSDHWVARAEVSPIVTRRRVLTVWDAGADYYWGSYSFAGATLIRDPRGNDLWVLPLRVRLASEGNDWVQVTVAPASKQTLGWAFDAKLRWLRLGVERNSRYDFSARDNIITTLGVEFKLPEAAR